MFNRKLGCRIGGEREGDRENYFGAHDGEGDWVKKLESRSGSCDVIKGTLERGEVFSVYSSPVMSEVVQLRRSI